jgi:hypothetical protein
MPKTGIAVGAVVASVGAFGLLVGSFLPWATTLGGLVTRSGLDGGDGWFTVGLAAAIAGVASFALRGMAKQWIGATLILAAGAAGAIAGVEFSDVHGRVGLSYGSGLDLIVISTVAIAVGGVLEWRRANRVRRG